MVFLLPCLHHSTTIYIIMYFSVFEGLNLVDIFVLWFFIKANGEDFMNADHTHVLNVLGNSTECSFVLHVLRISSDTEVDPPLSVAAITNYLE